MRIFTKDRLDGITGKDDWLRLDPDTWADARANGSVLSRCWCCGNRFVVVDDEESTLDAAGRAWLAAQEPGP